MFAILAVGGAAAAGSLTRNKAVRFAADAMPLDESSLVVMVTVVLSVSVGTEERVVTTVDMVVVIVVTEVTVPEADAVITAADVDHTTVVEVTMTLLERRQRLVSHRSPVRLEREENCKETARHRMKASRRTKLTLG